MEKPDYNLDHKIALDSLLLILPGVKAGKMFGYPAYYVNQKLFACVYGEGVGVKVPEALANELLSKQNIIPFQPLGKPRMREWIQINRMNSADYGKDLHIFMSAVAFVSNLPPKG